MLNSLSFSSSEVSLSTKTSSHELVILDAGVNDIQKLIEGIKPGVDWVVLNRNQDGIEQITRILANYPEIKTLHLVSHGAPGCLFLGNTQLNLETLEGYTTQLQSWFASSSPTIKVPLVKGDLGGSLLLYGCNVAVGDAGEEFINKLHNLTGATIAASSTPVGSILQGGNWNLDVTTAPLTIESVFQAETLAAYAGLLGGTPIPIGDPLQTTLYSNDHGLFAAKGNVSVSALNDGGFVIVAAEYDDSYGSHDWRVYGQRYDQNGNAVGDKFHVSTLTPWGTEEVEEEIFKVYDKSSQYILPSVTSLRDGGFVVAWPQWYILSHYDDPDRDDGSEEVSHAAIYGQRFDANGNKVNGEFQIARTSVFDLSSRYPDEYKQLPYDRSSYKLSALEYKFHPSLTGLNDGGFVVAWSDGYNSFGQRFDAQGNEVGDEFEMFTGEAPKIKALNDGGWVAISDQSSNRYDGVLQHTSLGKLYDASGSSITFTETSYRAWWTEESSVTVLNDGGFVVTGTKLNERGIYGQRYDSNGNQVGVSFQISEIALSPSLSSVTALNDGGFVVTWDDYDSQSIIRGGIYSDTESEVYGQRYDANGNKVGANFQVFASENMTSNSSPSAIALSDGRFIVISTGFIPGEGASIYGQMFGGLSTISLSSSGDAQESSTQGEFQLTLDTAYPEDITVYYTVSGGTAVEGTDYTTPGSVVVPANTTSVAIPINVIDDNVDEDIENITIQLTQSPDNYTVDDTASSSTLNLLDNDTAGITVDRTTGNTSEAGGYQDFRYKLNTQPTQNVTIYFTNTDSSESTLSTSSLTFTPSNWNTYQTLRVTGVNDDIDDDTVGYTVSTSVSSSDSKYNGISTPNLSLSNTDNDTAGITVNALDTTTSEDGATGQFQFKLNTQPTQTVVINFGSNPAEGTLSTPSLVFTPSNWNIEQTLTVTGKDDLFIDGTRSYTINPTVSSSDSKYGGMSISPLSLTNADNDVPGIIVTPIDTATSESGETGSFQVSLSAGTLSNVTLDINNSDSTEGSLSKSSLFFNSSNWNTPQTVTVTGLDDFIDDDEQSYTLSFDATGSSDSFYRALTEAKLLAAGKKVNLTNSDNDTAGITVNRTSGTTTEAGGEASFSYKLDTQPLQNVTISFNNPSAEGTLSASSLTFTPSNWNVEQTLTVTGADDFDIDGEQTYTIATSVESTDGKYNGMATDSLQVTNLNNDTAGITVETTDATSSEAGDTATFNVVLNARPAAEVTVDLKGLVPTEGTLSATALTFNSDNWNVPQTVTVTGVNEQIDDDDHTYTLSFDASNSSDADFAALTEANLSALGHEVDITNQDDDVAGITLSAGSGLTSEDETQTRFTVQLDSQPTENVELILTSSNEFEGISTASVMFSPDNWNTAQTVTVTGMNDAVEDGAQDYTITLTPRTGDAKYQAVTPAVFDATNLDNEVIPTAGVTVSGNPSENGGLATFTITLANPALPGKGRIYYSLSGTATNGKDYGQILDSVEIAPGETQATVTLQVIDDRIADDGETVTLTVLSVNEDGEYIPSPTHGSATITIADNGDTAGVVITPTQATTNEAGGQARFEVMLTSQPTADVTLDLVSSDIGEGSLSVSSLVFTPENWDTPQSVTVIGVDDEYADGEQFYTVQATATSDDDNYEGINIDSVHLTNLDNENVAVLITPSEGEVAVSEAGVTDTYEIALTQPPSGLVEITAYADSQTEISLDGINFADSQTVTLDGTTFQKTVYVRAIDDNEIEGPGTGTVVHRITNSSDSQYPTDLPIPSLSIAVEDNDLPTVEIISTEPGTEESTIPGQLNLRLSQPAPKGGITVYYEVNGDSTAKASNAGSFAIGEPDYFALPGEVFIPEGETGATITVVPTPNDAASEPEETVNITLLSGKGYELGSQATDSTSIFDDDIPGVRLNESGNWTRGIEGSGDIYTVSLTSQPRETVTVNFNSDGQIGAIAPLTFTSDNWKIPQRVSVQFADDEIANGDRITTISHSITSADTDYDGMTVRDVEATILDNEVPGITVTVNETALAEGETDIASYSIVLDTQPNQDVTVSFIPDGSLEAIAPLTFTAANWNVPQDVLITPVDNDRVTGTRRSTILHRVSSADTGYNRKAIDTITVSIAENDQIGITVTPSDDTNRVREEGYTDTYWTVSTNLVL
jgi:hypothetical protein